MSVAYLTRHTPSTAFKIHRRVISPSMYNGWTREQLIARLTELENTTLESRQQQPLPEKTRKDFQFSAYSKRKIALKFCYSGWEYGGLAFQNMNTSLPTVEGVLYDALVKARLIDSAGGLEGCGWERCGRTDRGVSAAGQVISLWVRSAFDIQKSGDTGASTESSRLNALPETQKAASELTLMPSSAEHMEDQHIDPQLDLSLGENDFRKPSTSQAQSLSSQKPKFEHDYLAILNRLLPPTIRIIAWSPVASNFSARFSCRHRHYKYFFSSNTVSGPDLDLDRMRAAASLLVGEHDFRNMCKLDPAKQISSFKRTIMHAGIEPVSVDSDGRGMYVFNLIGSAFLYHQVRHIMAILFMIGHGHEDLSVITALMNVENGAEPDATEVIDSKPEYQMADALPLLLWDCGYPEGELDWQATNGSPILDGSEGRTELHQRLHAIHSRSQIYTVLNDQFLTAVSRFHPPSPSKSADAREAHHQPALASKLLIPLGGGSYKRTSPDKYVPLLMRKRLDPVDKANERWRLGKGFRRNERKKVAAAAETTDSYDDGNE